MEPSLCGTIIHFGVGLMPFFHCNFHSISEPTLDKFGVKFDEMEWNGERMVWHELSCYTDEDKFCPV